jgi:hypothetical protein
MTLCNAKPALPTTQMAEFSPSEAGVHLFRGKGTEAMSGECAQRKSINANRFGHTSLEGNANLCAKFFGELYADFNVLPLTAARCRQLIRVCLLRQCMHDHWSSHRRSWSCKQRRKILIDPRERTPV